MAKALSIQLISAVLLLLVAATIIGCGDEEVVTETVVLAQTTETVVRVPLPEELSIEKVTTASAAVVAPTTTRRVPGAPTGSLQILDQSASPTSGGTGTVVRITATVRGNAVRVMVPIFHFFQGRTNIVDLSRDSTSGDISSWSGFWTIPPSPLGFDYRIRVQAIGNDGTEVRYWGTGSAPNQIVINAN